MSSQKLILIPVFVLVATSLFFTSLLFWIVGKGVFEDAKLQARKTQELERLKAEEHSLSVFQETRSKLAGELQMLNALFVDPNNPIGFIEFLEDKAEALGLIIQIIPSAPKQAQGDLWPSMMFTVSSKGSFLAWTRFLEQIEYAPYLLQVQNVHIAATQETTPGKGVSEFSLELKLYTRQ